MGVCAVGRAMYVARRASHPDALQDYNSKRLPTDVIDR